MVHFYMNPEDNYGRLIEVSEPNFKTVLFQCA